MKSKLFGLGAKMALALLAVGMTVTSCYDSENVDIIQPDQPVAPKYYIAGNITDAETGDIVTNATVTIDGTAVTLTNGAFNQEVSVGDAGASFVVAVVADGYRDVSRTIFFPAMGNGTVTVGNADFALVGVTASDLLEEDPLQDNYPVSDEEYTLLKTELENVLPESVAALCAVYALGVCGRHSEVRGARTADFHAGERRVHNTDAVVGAERAEDACAEYCDVRCGDGRGCAVSRKLG